MRALHLLIAAICVSCLPAITMAQVEIKSNNFQAVFNGRVLTDAGICMGNSYQKLANSVCLKQVALVTNIRIGEHLIGKAEIDYTGGVINLLDNYIGYEFNKKWNIKAGFFQEGFSMEMLNSYKDLLFMERTVAVSALAPGHHVGVQAVYQPNEFMFTGGVHFQRVMNSGDKKVSDENYRRGISEGYSVTGRAVWMHLNERKSYGIHLGAAISYRTPKTDVTGTDGNQLRYSASEAATHRLTFMDTGIITDVDHEFLSGVEAAMYWRSWRIQGEYIYDRISRGSLSDASLQGGYIQAAYLWGGTHQVDRSRGAFTQPLVGKKGAWELAARYDYADFNSYDILGGHSQQYTVGMNYYINNNLKVMLNYSYVNYDANANGDGTLFIGKNEAGELTNDPVEVYARLGKPGNRFSTVNLRFQIRF